MYPLLSRGNAMTRFPTVSNFIQTGREERRRQRRESGGQHEVSPWILDCFVNRQNVKRYRKLFMSMLSTPASTLGTRSHRS